MKRLFKILATIAAVFIIPIAMFYAIYGIIVLLIILRIVLS